MRTSICLQMCAGCGAHGDGTPQRANKAHAIALRISVCCSTRLGAATRQIPMANASLTRSKLVWRGSFCCCTGAYQSHSGRGQLSYEPCSAHRDRLHLWAQEEAGKQLGLRLAGATRGIARGTAATTCILLGRRERGQVQMLNNVRVPDAGVEGFLKLLSVLDYRHVAAS